MPWLMVSARLTSTAGTPASRQRVSTGSSCCAVASTMPSTRWAISCSTIRICWSTPPPALAISAE